MATLVGKPQASNSEGLAGLSTPVTYSKATGLALQLANMLASAGQVVPFMRKLTPAQFTSGTYDGTKPDGYTPAAYKLSMLEMPETIAVYDDVLKVCQPVMVYQVGTPTQLITSDFPIQLQTGNFTIGGKVVPAVSEGQSVLLRFYKNANIKINWAGSNITNNGLTDDVITTTTELAFVVTYLNGAYKVTEWLSPDFITAQLSTLKTTKKNNFASVINELFDKIPAPVTLPNYDATTLKLANNILSVILAPQATKAELLNHATGPIADFRTLYEDIFTNSPAIGDTTVVFWDNSSANTPFNVSAGQVGYCFATVIGINSRGTAQIAMFALGWPTGSLSASKMAIGYNEESDEIRWDTLNSQKSFVVTDFKNVSNILAQLEDNQVAAIYNTGSSIQNGPTGTGSFDCLGTIQKGSARGYVNAIFHVTNVAGGTDLASYVGVLYSNSTQIKWTKVGGGADETVIIKDFAQNIDSSSGNFEITPLVEVNLNDKLQIQGCFSFRNGQPLTSFNEVFRLSGEGAAILVTSAVNHNTSDKSIIILEYNGGDSILVRYDLAVGQVEDSATLEIFKITKISG
jgi:hypothetical protein